MAPVKVVFGEGGPRLGQGLWAEDLLSQDMTPRPAALWAVDLWARPLPGECHRA